MENNFIKENKYFLYSLIKSKNMDTSKAPSFSILAPRSGQDRSIINRISSWVSETLGQADASLPSLYTIMVSQVQCFDPDCVPLETVILLVGGSKSDRYSEKIQKPSAEVRLLSIFFFKFLSCNFYSIILIIFYLLFDRLLLRMFSLSLS